MRHAKNKLVFIGGLHRSGTSLLHKCISEHPEVSGFKDTGVPEDEGQHLQDIYNTAKMHGGPGTFGFDEGSHLNEDSSLVTDANAKKLFQQWTAHWDLSKPVLVEKSPPNLVRTRFLQALYPDSRFIILMRHPVAVAYATQKWSKTSTYSLVKHWLVCHERFKKDEGNLKNCMIVHYEDFIRDPNETLAEIWKFIGVEDYSPDREIRRGVNNKYFANWHALDQEGLLLKTYKKIIKLRFEQRVQKLGYSLDL